MRLIDADALERDGWKMSRTVRVDKATMEIQTRKPTDFPTIEVINKVVVKCAEYYKPTSIRNFVESAKAWEQYIAEKKEEFEKLGADMKEVQDENI